MSLVVCVYVVVVVLHEEKIHGQEFVRPWKINVHAMIKHFFSITFRDKYWLYVSVRVKIDHHYFQLVFIMKFVHYPCYELKKQIRQ